MSQDLLLEIGTEELPASFVEAAVRVLPDLLRTRLAELRLAHGAVRALGTPRRLALIAEAVVEAQPDLDEQVLGPPARVAFDAEGKPTRAAESFAAKLGCSVADLSRVETPKGEYVAARRSEQGAPAVSLLGRALARLAGEIPFRKSMRWGAGETPFGRPVRWLLALFGEQTLDFEFAGIRSGNCTHGHRFLAPEALVVHSARSYEQALRERHVLADGDERRRIMLERLHAAAQELGARLIEDDFLVQENGSLVEEPQIVAGSFDARFLELPDRVILDVARGHQRYFGLRAPDGKLLNRYLAVVNTALAPDNIRRGNDRVMSARLADARFFWDEDLKLPLEQRRPRLDGVLFHKRLGSVGDKLRRIDALLPRLAEACGLGAPVLEVARAGAALAKCDLVTLMVGELPELQGEMGRAYALRQGTPLAIADVIFQHYLPRGADDATAPGDAGALVAVADRLDTLVGCFAVGIAPTGNADPLALRRSALGVLRTLLERRWDPSLEAVVRAAYTGFCDVKLDLSEDATVDKLSGFFRDRLRGVLEATLPGDVVEACLAASSDRPHDARRRAEALAAVDAVARASAGEVFKRAANIAKDASEGPLLDPGSVLSNVHASERALFEAFDRLRAELASARAAGDYGAALSRVAAFAPALERYFSDVFVMDPEPRVRDNRLRLMREIEGCCGSLAAFNLLAPKP